MNKRRDTEKGLFALPVGLAREHICSEIAKRPRMSKRVAADVARNLDVLLEELKDCGVSMHEVCSAAALGNRDDRDAKALYKYRNPDGSKPRDYISKAPLYAKVAEAIADIKDHPYSGSSGELLRRVFAGTSYAPEITASGDASIALKVILDELTTWITRQLNLAQAYERLQRMYSEGNRGASASLQYEHATKPLLDLQWHGCRLELGYRDVRAEDNEGQPLRVKFEEDESYDLCYREEVSLFIGIDDDFAPRPYLAFEKSLVAKTFREKHDVSWVKDGAPEGPEFGELIFEDDFRKGFRLPRETVARTVDLNGLDQRLQDAYDNNEPEEADPVTEAFLEANPEYESHPYCRGHACYAREIQTMQVSADALEYLEEFLAKPEGEFSPAGMFPAPLIRASGKHLLHGDGVLAHLIAWFTKSSWLMYQPDELETTFLGKDFSNGPMTPGAGWIGVNPKRNTWSAADILWLRCKMFVVGVEAEFVSGTKQQQADYNTLLKRLREDGPRGIQCPDTPDEPST